jgi:hypothetical protein
MEDLDLASRSAISAWSTATWPSEETCTFVTGAGLVDIAAHAIGRGDCVVLVENAGAPLSIRFGVWLTCTASSMWEYISTGRIKGWQRRRWFFIEP